MEAAKPLDTTAAEGYERCIVPAFMMPLVKGVIETAAPRPGERVLDIACGTGLVARLVAPRLAPGGTISNLDFDPAMLAVAQRLVACPPDVNMTWHCASALSMPLPPARSPPAMRCRGCRRNNAPRLCAKWTRHSVNMRWMR